MSPETRKYLKLKYLQYGQTFSVGTQNTPSSNYWFSLSNAKRDRIDTEIDSLVSPTFYDKVTGDRYRTFLDETIEELFKDD